MATQGHWRVNAPAAVVLVLVPTLFSVFPRWSDWTLVPKLGVLAVWLVAAITVISAGVDDSERLHDLLDGTGRRRDLAREVAGRFILRTLLSPDAAGFPSHYKLQLFIPDDDGLHLVAQYGSSGDLPSEAWAIGQGATGAAWASCSYVRVRGSKVSDGTYGLNEQQQERYRALRVVAAAPVLDASVRPIAVLTASSTIDDGFLFTGGGPAHHRELAEVIARVLIDNFGISGD